MSACLIDTFLIIIYLPEFGVNLVSRQHLLVSGTGDHTFDYMEECGYILTVPDNYSASSVVKVDCCLINNYNNFQFPDDCDTAMTSALYCINTSHNLNNPVTFRVQHCALVQESSELDHICFITADSTSGPPYQFSYIDHDYEIYREYGEVTLSHFCWLATVWRKIRGRPRINYCGLLYQTKRTITSQMFHFILIKNLATCIRVSASFISLCNNLSDIKHCVNYDTVCNACSICQLLSCRQLISSSLH